MGNLGMYTPSEEREFIIFWKEDDCQIFSLMRSMVMKVYGVVNLYG